MLIVFILLSTPAHAQLAYFSDYFSFVGEDAKGKVAFALDTNRGQDGAAYQAEHFLVLHDETSGWAALQGNGRYPNTQKILQGLPDSEHFQFQGKPEEGIAISGPTNALSLTIDPLPTLIDRQNGNDHYRMGAAPAILNWQGRRLVGRVIYEYIQFDNWNRLTRTYFGFWKDFHGLYAMTTEAGSDRRGDFYLHAQQSEKLAPLIGKVEGFATFEDETLRLSEADIETGDTEFAWGFYRWPLSWIGQVAGENPESELRFEIALSQQKRFANWVIGGFAMGIITGELHYQGKRFSVYGLGEIIK